MKERADAMAHGAEEHAATDFAKWSRHMEQHQALLQKRKLLEAERKVREAAEAAAKPLPVKLADPAPYNAYDDWFG